MNWTDYLFIGYKNGIHRLDGKNDSLCRRLVGYYAEAVMQKQRMIRRYRR